MKIGCSAARDNAATGRRRTSLRAVAAAVGAAMIEGPAVACLCVAGAGMLGAPLLEAADESNALALIPAPVKVELKAGLFELTKQTVLVANPGAEREADQLAAGLRAATGLELRVRKRAAGRPAVRLELAPALEARLGREGYQLSIASTGAVVRAASEAGLFYGGVTFRQLMPPEVFGAEEPPGQSARRWTAPCAEIEDYPRFAWRGLLLDVGRHYMPIEFIKKLVDVLAMHKLNVFQLHLTDDQGWRVEIKKYPRLTQVGSMRKESPKRGAPNQGDATPYGPYFYTQRQLRELVAYAQKRHVTILPEIEMPGHFRAALAAYPEFSCRGGP